MSEVLDNVGGGRGIERRLRAVPRGVLSHSHVMAVSASGARIVGTDGRTYLDLAAGIGAVSLGHGHPGVTEAVQRQAAILVHTCAHVCLPWTYVELAERLAALGPLRGGSKTLLVNSGAEAVENAVKIAKAFTGRRAVVALENGFHGRTALTLALTGRVAPYSDTFGNSLAGVFHAPAPYCLRCPASPRELCCTLSPEGGLRRLFRTQVAPSEVAAIVIEPIQGEGGFIVPPPGYLRDVEELCRQHGIVLIVDEIQSGFGRSGHLFAFEHDGIEPDLVCIGKAVANGYPLAAVVGRSNIMDAPGPGSLGGTYGGNPVACAAALAVLDAFEREDMPARARRMGEVLESRVRRWQARFGQIAEVRGRGAMWAAEFVLPDDGIQPDPGCVTQIIESAAHHGVIVISAGLHANVLRLLPPLMMEESELTDALSRLEAAIADVCGG